MNFCQSAVSSVADGWGVVPGVDGVVDVSFGGVVTVVSELAVGPVGKVPVTVLMAPMVSLSHSTQHCVEVRFVPYQPYGLSRPHNWSAVLSRLRPILFRAGSGMVLNVGAGLGYRERSYCVGIRKD